MFVKNFKEAIRNMKLKKIRGTVSNDICLISSNCNGAMILHDLGLRFNSPFVNLWIGPKDFLKLLNDLQGYMNHELEFISETGINYPVAQLNDIKIYFQHYKTNEEAEAKWNERKQRMNYDKLFVLFTDRDGCTYEDIVAFDNLPYKNKVIFVNKAYREIKSAQYIKGFEEETSVGQCMNFRTGLSFRRYYDDFDYVSWFNSYE